MKVVVTGGAGFIGSHLVDRLIIEGSEVIVIDNLSRGRLQNIQQHLNNKSMVFHNADIRNYDKIVELIKGSEIVYHLAAQSNVMGAIVDLDYSFESNVIGTYNVLKAAKENSARRLIFTSSREAYGEATALPVKEDHPLRSKNFYGASKVAGEKYCEIYQNMESLEIVILRLANVYGRRDFDRVIPIFINNALNNANTRIFGGKQVIDFIRVETVVEALIQSINNDKAAQGATNIGSGKGTTLFDLAKRIQDLFKSSNEIIIEPARSVEVVKFIADVRRMFDIFNIQKDDDPLNNLSKMVD